MNDLARTDFLMPRSTLITGAGTVFNLGGVYFAYNSSETPEQADAKALASDWQIVGHDLRQALKTVSRDNDLQLRFGF